MTVHTAHPGHRFSTKTAGIALAGAVLAVGAGYGVATFVLDERGRRRPSPNPSPAARQPARAWAVPPAPTARSAP